MFHCLTIKQESTNQIISKKKKKNGFVSYCKFCFKLDNHCIKYLYILNFHHRWKLVKKAVKPIATKLVGGWSFFRCCSIVALHTATHGDDGNRSFTGCQAGCRRFHHIRCRSCCATPLLNHAGPVLVSLLCIKVSGGCI